MNFKEKVQLLSKMCKTGQVIGKPEAGHKLSKYQAWLRASCFFKLRKSAQLLWEFWLLTFKLNSDWSLHAAVLHFTFHHLTLPLIICLFISIFHHYWLKVNKHWKHKKTADLKYSVLFNWRTITAIFLG